MNEMEDQGDGFIHFGGDRIRLSAITCIQVKSIRNSVGEDYRLCIHLNGTILERGWWAKEEAARQAADFLEKAVIHWYKQGKV